MDQYLHLSLMTPQSTYKMITYTDYILSGLPYSYFRMDDNPISINNTTTLFFIDSSGHRKHQEMSINQLHLDKFSNNLFSSFNDSKPFGGFQLPVVSSSFVSTMDGISISGGVINSFPIFSLPFDILDRPYANPSHPKPGYSKTHYRVEFFLKGFFVSPAPSLCTLAGDIYSPAMKIGPIVFFVSQKWDPSIIEGNCSTISSEPPKLHMVIDTVSQFINSSNQFKTYRVRFNVWSAFMGNSNSSPNTFSLDLSGEQYDNESDIQPSTNTSYYLLQENSPGELNRNSDHRIIIEWEYNSNQSITVHTYIDGNGSNSTLMVSRRTININQNSDFENLISSPENYNNWLTYNQELPLIRENRQFSKQNSMDYSIGLINYIAVGGFSFSFGHSYFRNTIIDSKIIESNESWNILMNTPGYQFSGQYSASDQEYPEYTILSDSLAHSKIVTTQNNTLKQQFDVFMLVGADQIRVRKIDANITNSDYHVRCFFGMPYKGFPILNYGNFKVGDWIELGRSKQIALNRKWKITEIGNDYIGFITKEVIISENCSMGSVIVKQISVRETGDYKSDVFSWIHSSGTYSKLDNNKPFSFTINDLAITTSASIGNPTDATSAAEISHSGQILYLKRNMKNNFQIFSEIRSNQVDASNMHWRILGSPLQLHVILGYGRNSLSHHQILSVGYFRDNITNELEPMLQGYLSGNYGNPGYNYAFLFSDWILMDSGHLLCRDRQRRDHQQGAPTSDAQYIIYRNKNYQKEPSRKDLGFHMYPAPHSPRDIKLIYAPEQ